MAPDAADLPKRLVVEDYRPDGLEAQQLRQRLEGTGVSVTRMGDNITLNMPSNITFALNSADLNAQFFSALDGVSMVLKEYDKTVIEVAGHTDSSGSDQYNQALSERRAQAVRRALMLAGAQAGQITTVSYGEERPAASGSDEESWRLNRRVEIVYR